MNSGVGVSKGKCQWDFLVGTSSKQLCTWVLSSKGRVGWMCRALVIAVGTVAEAVGIHEIIQEE